MVDKKEEFEKHMLMWGYEPDELVLCEETGEYKDGELRAMWVGFKLGWDVRGGE